MVQCMEAWLLADRETSMNQQHYTAVIQQSEGWIEDIPGVNAQELTRESLLDSLRECLADVCASSYVLSAIAER